MEATGLLTGLKCARRTEIQIGADGKPERVEFEVMLATVEIPIEQMDPDEIAFLARRFNQSVAVRLEDTIEARLPSRSGQRHMAKELAGVG